MRALAAPTAPTASSSLSAGRCRNQRHLKPTIVSPQHGKQQHQHHQHHLQQHDCSRQAAAVSRRAALLAGSTATPGLLLLLQPLAAPQPAAAAEAVAAASAASSTAAGSSSLQVYENTQQQYRLLVPPAWERKDKAGADVLFEDPDRRSTSVGVTVSPVRVPSIDRFGDLAAVGQRLLETERKKESTLNVELLASAQRQGASGATLYDYEYELDSTRGKKRIFNTVTITGSKLYILNGNFKCSKEGEGCSADEATAALALLRQVAASFDAGSSSTSSSTSS